MSKRKRHPRAAPRSKAPPLRPGPERIRDEAAGAASGPAPKARLSARRAQHDQRFADAVTLLGIAKPEEGGVQEIALPGDRSLSPPSPPPARRGREHPVARRAAYILLVAALTFIFVVFLIDVLRVG